MGRTKLGTLILLTVVSLTTLAAATIGAQSPLCLFGCANADINTRDFVTASENLVKAAEQVAKFDPIGIKQLLNTNADLQQKYSQLSTLLAGYTIGDPVIVLSGQLLKFRAAQASGNFRVSMWVDDKESHTIVARRPILDKAYKLSLPTGAQAAQPTLDLFRRMPAFRNTGPGDVDMKLAGAIAMVDAEKKAADDKFDEFLRNATPVPIPAAQDIDLNQILNSVGSHRLFVEVTPVSRNAQNRWSFEGQLIITRPGAPELLPMDFVFDSDVFPNQAMNAPLPPQILSFTVR